jgi:hypothetical protein
MRRGRSCGCGARRTGRFGLLDLQTLWKLPRRMARLGNQPELAFYQIEPEDRWTCSECGHGAL